MYEIIAYTQHGMYAELVTASTMLEAARIGKPLVRKLVPPNHKIIMWKFQAQ